MVTQGQIVHYVWDTVDDFESVWPALVVAVNDDGTADLTVFHSNGRIAWRDHVIESVEAAAGAWHCPPKEKDGKKKDGKKKDGEAAAVNAAESASKAEAKAARAARPTFDTEPAQNVGALHQDNEGMHDEQSARNTGTGGRHEQGRPDNPQRNRDRHP